MPVVLPKPKRVDPSTITLRAEPLGERDGADVRRPREDLRDLHRLGAARLGVVDDAVGDVDRVRQRELRLRRHDPSESAPETVTSLKVEPGSYRSVTARLR